MRATEFERRHPTVLRHVLIAAAVGIYFFYPEDIIWKFVRNSPMSRTWEREAFLIATILIGAGAGLCTRASAFALHAQLDTAGDPGRRSLQLQQYLGEFLYAIGFASLVPLWGFALLVCGEGVRILRLLADEHESSERPVAGASDRSQSDTAIWKPRWLPALREQAAKWGIFVSMLAFTITLADRLVEILACASAVVWAILNVPTLRKRRADKGI